MSYKIVDTLTTFEDIMIDSPEMLVLKLYDLGIRKCLEKDRAGVQKVLKELIGSLNFEYKDMAGSFYELYDYAMRSADAESFDEAANILEGLRSAWEKLVAKDGISVPILTYEG